MSYSNGLLPSTTTSTNKSQRGLPGIGFKLTADGNFDINGKLLTNVAGPVNGDDATNKNYVDAENTKQDIAIADKASKSDLNSKLNIDGSNSMTSNLNLNNNKVINISGGTNNGDAVNYGQLLSHSSNNHQNNYHLQKSFTFYKNFGDKAQLNIQNINITNHNHHDLLVVKKEGSDPGFHGEAWVSLKMTNDLPAGDYTVIFETFSANIVSASNITFLNNETLLQQVRGDANYKIITFSHDYQTTHSKSYIQFTTNGNARDITFEIRYNGSSYNNSNLNFLFYSRVVAGRIGYAFNHKIFDIDDVQLNNQILYFEDVNLNGNKIKNIAHPTEDEDGANKKYVDDEIAKLPHSDNSTLKLDGSRAMTGTLNLGGQRVINIKGFVEDDSSQAASDAQKYDVVNWGKIHEIRGDLKREINAVEYEALNRINPDPMEDDIDMANHKIINVADPTDLTDAANKKYVDDEIAKIPHSDAGTLKLDGSRVMAGDLNMNDHKINNLADPTDLTDAANKKYVDNEMTLNIKAAKQENVFSFVMDDDLFKEDDSDIKKIGKVDKDFYDLHKETYQFNINYDSNIGYYSTRTGISLKAIDLGEYTLVFEMYFNETKIDKNEVIVNAVSTPLNISHNITNKFADHSRTIINFHKYGNIGIIDLDIDITMKNKGGISYDPTTTIYVIVYGVSGHQNDVESSVWDRVYYIENDKIKFEALIDMNSHKITGVSDGTADDDAINKKQLDSKISELDIPSKVHYYTSILAYNQITKNNKIIQFTNITSYITSNNSHFTLNNDRITVSKRGIYQIYFRQKVENYNANEKAYIMIRIYSKIRLLKQFFSEKNDNSGLHDAHINHYINLNAGFQVKFSIHDYRRTSNNNNDATIMIRKII